MNNIRMGLYPGFLFCPPIDNTILPDGVQRMPAVNYTTRMAVEKPLSYNDLYKRNIQIMQPLLYTHHSQSVANLLQQRALLDYQLQKTVALTNYMQAVMAFYQHLPVLQQQLKYQKPCSVPSGFDLLYQGPTGSQPISFFQNFGALPRNATNELPHHLNKLSRPLSSGTPELHNLLPSAKKHAESLQSDLMLNEQHLTFNGYPPPRISKPNPIAYPLSDIARLKATKCSGNLNSAAYTTNQFIEKNAGPGFYLLPNNDHIEPCNNSFPVHGSEQLFLNYYQRFQHHVPPRVKSLQGEYQHNLKPKQKLSSKNLYSSIQHTHINSMVSKSKSKGYQKVTKHDVKKEKATKNLPKKEIIGNNILKKEEVETEKLNKFKDCKEKEKFKKVYNGEEKAKLDEKNAKKDKVKIEKINAEKEKVKLEKINAEKEKVKFEKINAEKEKANLDKANLDKANAEKEKVKLEKINAEKEKAKLDKANAEKEKAKLDKANAEKEKAKLDKANAEKEKAKLDKANAEKEKVKLDKANAEKEKAKLDKANAEKEKAKLDKANAEKEKAKLDKANAEKEKAKLDEVNAAKTQAKLDEVNAAKTKAKLDEVNAAKTKAKLDEVNAAKTKAKLDEVNAAKTQAKLDEVNAAKTKAKLDEVNAAKTKVDNEKKVIESKKADKVTYDNTETEKKNFDNIETQPAKETKKKNKEEEIVYGVATKEYLNEENLLPWDESDKEAQINNLIKAEEKKQLDIKNSRLKKTNITTEMLNGERCYIISDTKYILASADNICIGQKNGPVAAVTFPDDKNEMLILLKNETESIPVIANRNGDYIQIFKGEAIRGFSSLYYSYSGSGNYSTSDKRTIPVFIDGKHFSIDKTRGEQYIEIGNKKFIACIDGRVREIIIGEVTSGFFDHAYYIKNNNTHRMPIEQHEALERSIDRIRRVATPAEARDVLTKFFNSVSGKTLTQNNHYAIDKKKTLDFIVCYKKAIELEIKEEKEDKEIKAEQDKKKNERLKAISEIKDFIENINNNDPKLNEKCRCAIQLSGRVRERSLVTQKAIPYCGGFAMLQEAWGINPCKMVHIALDLLEKGETTTDTMVVGCVKKLSTPDYFKWRDYDEAYADSLLISIHYNLKKASSLAQEDAMNATYLGVPVKKCNYPDSKSDSFKKQDMQTRFLQELTLVSRGKGSICATAHGAINIFFLHELQKGFNRKNVSGPVNIEAAFKEFKSEEQINHAVVIEKFHVTGVGDNKFIECKLHTWGVMHHLKMRVSTFFDNFDPSSFFIANMDASQKFEFFSDIDKVVMRKNDNTATIGVLKLLDGTEHHLKKGDQISIENIVYKFNGGADWDTYPLS